MSGAIGDHQEHLKFRYAVYMVIAFVFLLWFVKALEFASGTSYAHLGILPRTLKGTIGIFTGPLIHGDIVHLISNTLPLIVMGVLLFYFYHRIAIEIFLWIYFVTGFWIWLLARNAYHIGASGVVYGMASFLFFSGLFRKNKQLMTISGIIILLYGGMLYGIFPDFVESNVSWEAHFLGGFAGMILAFLFRKTEIDLPEGPESGTGDENRQDYFSTPSPTGDIHASYSYKPKPKNTDSGH
jgi:membrane associated rhomboid family serine protease